MEIMRSFRWNVSIKALSPERVKAGAQSSAIYQEKESRPGAAWTTASKGASDKALQDLEPARRDLTLLLRGCRASRRARADRRPGERAKFGRGGVPRRGARDRRTCDEGTWREGRRAFPVDLKSERGT